MTIEQHRCTAFSDPAGDRKPHHRNQQGMFGLQHARGEAFGRVAGPHRYPRLRDHRARI